MFCNNCGNEFGIDEVFCHNCGTPRQSQQPQQQQPQQQQPQQQPQQPQQPLLQQQRPNNRSARTLLIAAGAIILTLLLTVGFLVTYIINNAQLGSVESSGVGSTLPTDLSQTGSTPDTSKPAVPTPAETESLPTGDVGDSHGDPPARQKEPDPRRLERLTAISDDLFLLLEEAGIDYNNSFSPDGERLVLMLAADNWFDSGSSDIQHQMVDLAERIGNTIYNHEDDGDPFAITVVGHTDNVPINTVRFPSNWHLSISRAVNFLYSIMPQGKLSHNCAASGAGDMSPIVTNDTAEGRQMNRRIEIIITFTG